MNEQSVENDALLRRIADCLEDHLSEYGFAPYRYPSGENKSISLIGGNVVLSGADGVAWRLAISRALPPEPTVTCEDLGCVNGKTVQGRKYHYDGTTEDQWAPCGRRADTCPNPSAGTD